ncbi:hemolysin family protein [Spartinivicinus ruber]|uniref:hemolysin family protein n=1 Tax=Spartinivicinus ruber TaxID=2683272 RepID=UPI0013D29103|nr:hemolysin family protein [Spartinivicinus ruber]
MAFFVAAEFALVKAKAFRIESMASESISSAKLVVRIQDNLEAYLAACQLGITMASLGLGWVGEPAVEALLLPLFNYIGIPDPMIHTSAFIIGFLFFSSLHIVVGEQVPKTFAIRKSEPVSLWVAYPLHITYLLSYPLNWLLNNASRAILSWFKVEEASLEDIYTGDELRGLVTTSEEHGELETDRATMLRNLFDFDQRLVGRVMIPRTELKVLDVSLSPEENLKVIKDSGHSRFPLIDSKNSKDEIVGIILVKDLYAKILEGESSPWKDLHKFAREALVVPEMQRVADIFDAMRERRAHISIVVDEYGKLAGLVTLEDLLEEIVGDIEDETDTNNVGNEIVQLSDNLWEVDGLLSISDASRLIGVEVPDELDANTLSGLCILELGRMPVVDDVVEKYNYRFTVKTVDGHRIGKLLVEKIIEPDK